MKTYLWEKFCWCEIAEVAMASFLTRKCNDSEISWKNISQLTFTCSKPRIETLEKGVKYVQS